MFPGVDGGANWMSHSYSPLTRLLYVFARDERRVFTKNAIRHAAEENNAAPTGRPRPAEAAAEARRAMAFSAPAAIFRMPEAAGGAASGSRPRKAGAKWSRSIRCRAISSGNTRSSRLHGVV